MHVGYSLGRQPSLKNHRGSGSGTLPGSQPVEAMGLEQVKQTHFAKNRYDPIRERRNLDREGCTISTSSKFQDLFDLDHLIHFIQSRTLKT